jgi:hypothetical protein
MDVHNERQPFLSFIRGESSNRAVPLFTALVLVAEPSIAQDKGKTAAAELTSQSRAAGAT